MQPETLKRLAPSLWSLLPFKGLQKECVCSEACVSRVLLTSAGEPFSTDLMMGTRFLSSRVKP